MANKQDSERFASLPRPVKEAAYNAVREKVGSGEIVTIKAMLEWVDESQKAKEVVL